MCEICGETFGHKAGCPEADSMPEKVCLCDLCDEYIYRGDKTVEYDGICCHEECFIDEYGKEA